MILRAEIGPGVDPALAARRLQETFDDYYRGMPDWMKPRLEQVVSLLRANPLDSYWRERYANFGESAATGGSGKINFYNGNFYSRYQGTFNHEMGHIVGDGGGPIQPSRWKAAQDSDQVHSRNEFEVKDTYEVYNEHRPTVLGGTSVSRYGENAIAEDWAESIRLYLQDKRDGYIGSRNGIRFSFREAFPNRARLIEEWADKGFLSDT